VTLAITLAAPFRFTRKNLLKKNEIVYFLVYDRKWMSLEQANQLLARGIEEGMVTFDGDMIRPLFDTASVNIPIGFRPSSSVFEKTDPVGKMLERIAKGTGLPLTQITSEMNSVIGEHFDDLIRPEAAVVILAKKYRVPYEDSLDILSKSLTDDR
jgi:hypothetical protein